MSTSNLRGQFPEFLNEAFPFYVETDRSLVITSLGRSLARIAPEGLVGRRFSDFASLNVPRVDFCAEACQSLGRQLLVFRLEGCDFLLRGQLYLETHHCLFLISARFHSTDTLTQYGLSISDYPQHDSAIETLFMQQAQKTQFQDLQNMITKLKQSAEETEQLQAAERALTHDMRAAGDLTIRFDTEGKMIDLKCTDRKYFAQRDSQFTGKPIEVLFPELTSSIIQGIAESDVDRPHPMELAIQKGAERFYFDARIARTLDSNFILLGRDITDRRLLERRLQYRALHDPLTDLPNRILLKRKVIESQQKNKAIAILLIDVNDFKGINDNLGHHVGDLLLQTFAKRMHATLGNAGTPSRLGGDEFGVLLNEVDTVDQALDVADRLYHELTQHTILDGFEIDPMVSIGLAFDQHGLPLDVLMRDADFAMYRAKKSANHNVVVCDEEVRDTLRERNAIKHDLANALRNNEFTAFYQPFIDLRDGSMAGWEALVRWNHPHRGLLTPGAFLDVAEEIGVIGPVGEKVMAEACQDLKTLSDRFPSYPFRVNVNLSSQQVQDDRIVDFIDSCLQDADIRAHHLTVEITETALIADLDKATDVFAKIRARGIKVALDDFGIGYSSLNYLKLLPIDCLKFDRSLVTNLCDSEKNFQIMKCVVHLGRTLGLTMVAEGIETPEQCQALRSLGCDFGQGFWFSKPKPMEDISRMLSEQLAGRPLVPNLTPGLPGKSMNFQ